MTESYFSSHLGQPAHISDGPPFDGPSTFPVILEIQLRRELHDSRVAARIVLAEESTQ